MSENKGQFKSGHDAIARMRGRQYPKPAEKPDGFFRDGQSLADRLDQWLDHQAMLNRSERAVLTQRDQLRVFLRWAQPRDILYPEQVTRSILESYQRHLYRVRKKNGNPLGVSTQKVYLVGVKRFFKWLCRQRLLEANPASELELPKRGKSLPKDTLSIPEVESVLSVPDITNPLGLRDRAMLETFYSSGIRRSELARLILGDLNMDNGTLFIRQGKGGNDRVVPIGNRALVWIRKYLDEVRPILLDSPGQQGLFLSGFGSPFRPDTLSRLVVGYLRKADIGRKKGGCHLLRHACATHMLEGGADIRYIQHLLGHANLDTTAIYTQVSIRKLKAIHAGTHPAETCGKAK